MKHKRVESCFPVDPFQCQGIKNEISLPEPLNSRIREAKFLSKSARIKRGIHGELIGCNLKTEIAFDGQEIEVASDNGLRLPETKGDKPLSVPVTLTTPQVDSLVSDASHSLQLALSVPDAGMETSQARHYRLARQRKAFDTSLYAKVSGLYPPAPNETPFQTKARLALIDRDVREARRTTLRDSDKSKERLESESIALGKRVASFSAFTGIETTLDRHKRLVTESKERETKRKRNYEKRQRRKLNKAFALLEV